MTERILCAAIWYKEIPLVKTFECNVLPINCDKGLVFCGYRHPQCIYTKCSVTGLKDSESGESIQGFLTSNNRFVDRKEGLIIAIRSNQLIREPHSGKLFSEDLY
jgi:hypothetical protein